MNLYILTLALVYGFYFGPVYEWLSFHVIGPFDRVLGLLAITAIGAILKYTNSWKTKRVDKDDLMWVVKKTAVYILVLSAVYQFEKSADESYIDFAKTYVASFLFTALAAAELHAVLIEAGKMGIGIPKALLKRLKGFNSETGEPEIPVVANNKEPESPEN